MDVPLGVGLGIVTLPGIWGGLWLSAWMSDRSAEIVLCVLLFLLTLYVGRQVLKDRQMQKSPVTWTTSSPGERVSLGERHEPPLSQRPKEPPTVAPWRSRKGIVVLCAASVFAGAAASLAGVGGALILVPLMVSLGMAPPVAVGTGLLFSFVAGLLAALGKVMSTPVPLTLLLMVIAANTVGILMGEAVARKVEAASMRMAIAAMCFLSAIAILL